MITSQQFTVYETFVLICKRLPSTKEKQLFLSKLRFFWGEKINCSRASKNFKLSNWPSG